MSTDFQNPRASARGAVKLVSYARACAARSQAKEGGA